MSIPPLLVGETSATVYFCSSGSPPPQGLSSRHTDVHVYVGSAIRQLGPNPSSEWNYTRIFYCPYCDDYHFDYLTTNVLPNRQHYINLIPNVLYSVAFIGCFRDNNWFNDIELECPIGSSSGFVLQQHQGFVSTRPQGEDFKYME